MKARTAMFAAITAGAGYFAWNRLRSRSRLDLKGRVVFITGGSRGLGLQLAREYGSRGARIAICARDSDELEAAKSDLRNLGIEAYSFVCDVSDRNRVESAVEEIQREMGSIDVLVNNAGLIKVGPLSTMDIADFEEAMGVMFWGTLYTTFAVLPSMRARQQGTVVNVTSIGGKVSVPHLVPYSCAKFAMVALSEGLRAELAPAGIRVSTIVPGLMRTGSHLNAKFKGKQDFEYRWFAVGAASAAVSIAAERAARAIVRATVRGTSEKVLSIPAALLARMHGEFPGFTTGILALMNRLLPSSGSNPAQNAKAGVEIEKELKSLFWKAITWPGRRAADSLNERSAQPASS